MNENWSLLTPEQKAHLHDVADKQFAGLKAGTPALDTPRRSRAEMQFQIAYESLEAIVAMAHEKEVVIYARQQLERIDELRRKP